MSADRILMLKLLGDTSSIDKSLKKSQGRLRSFAGSAGGWVKAAGIGIAIEGVEKLGEALGDAWTGFRDGEKAAGQLGTTWKNLRLPAEQLEGVIDAIGASAKRLGTDDTEAIKAYNTALQNTGGNAAGAMRRLRIAQDLVANGSAPNLQSALKLIDRAGSGSAATVRKFGLTADTAKGRIKELGEKVKGAAAKAAAMDPVGVLFNDLNEDLEGIVGSLSQGDLDGALSSLQQIGTDLGSAWNKVAVPITTILDKLTGGAFTTWMGQLSALGEKVGPKVGLAFDAISTAWTTLQPHLENALTFIQPLNDILSNMVAGGLGFILDAVTGAINTFTDLLKGDFAGAFDSVKTTVGNLVTDIDTFFSGLPGKMAGWLVDIAKAAGDIGSGIYNGIIDIVTGMPGALLEIVVDGVNQVIGAWNTLDFRIPKFELPAVDIGFPSTGNGDLDKLLPRIKGGPWPIFGGTEDLIPNLDPIALAQGGIVRRRPGGIIARVGEGRHDEAVVPLDGRGMGGNTYNINITATPATDRRALGREIVQLIRAYEQVDGRSWRTAPGR